MIIGLSGKANTGKNVVGSYLEIYYGFKRVAVADNIKLIAGLMGWDGNKDEKGRRFLQHLGDVGREYDANMWLIMLEKMAGKENICVSDIRLISEVKWIKERNGVIWRIERDTNSYLKNDLAKHKTETELDSYKDYSAIIHNSGTLSDLFNQVDELIGKLGFNKK
jgi:dephospho-CoA kinase